MLNNCSENPVSSVSKKIFLILSLCLFPYLIGYSQNIEPRFEHLTVADGLSENSVTAIFQDHLGYMWFGTTGGLSKYDGYKFINYRNDKGNSKSLSDDWIGCIYEDHLNNLWIGTQPYTARYDLNSKMGGLNLFNRKSETFICYQNVMDDSNSINSNYITSIKEDDIGNLWVGTNKGLNLFNKQTNKFHRAKFLDQTLSKETFNFLASLESKNLLIQSITKVENNANVRKKIILSEKTIVMALIEGEETADFGWVENSEGVKIIECEEGNNFYAGGRSDNRITIIIDTLEIGTYFLRYKSDASHSYNNWRNNNKPFYPEWWGIQLFKMDGNLLETFNNIKKNEFIEINLSVNGIIQDIVTKKILIATGKGIFAFNAPKNDFEKSNIILKTNDRLNIGFRNILNIYQSKNGVIWIGATNGLSSYSPITKEIKHHKSPLTPDQWINLSFNTITEDSDGIIWYGNPALGLIEFNPQKNDLTSYMNDEKNENSISENYVVSTYIDRSGVLWAGTSSRGIDKWDKKKWKFSSLKYNRNYTSLLSSYEIVDIFKDNEDRIWLSTNRGINIFEPSQNHLGLKYNNPVLSNTFKTIVTSIIQDASDNNTIWIGTWENGLFKYDPKINLLKHYEIRPTGFVILYLSIGNDNDLWIARYDGLYRLDKNTDNITKWELDPNDSINLSDNLIANLFRDNQHRFWIGSNSGGLLEYDKKLKK